VTAKSAAQLDAEIAESLRKSTRKQLPDAARAVIEERVLKIIEGTYKRYRESGRSVGHKEPCLSVSLITDDLRQQSGLPEDFRWATKTRQRMWTRSVLESMRRRGLIGASFGERSRCYEPKQ
jgi:hypothetical protein